MFGMGSLETAKCILLDADDFAVQVACDALEESGDYQMTELGRLLRIYRHVHYNYPKMKPADIESIDKQIADFNNSFALKCKRPQTEYWNKAVGWMSSYNKPIGIFYTGLQTSLTEYTNNPDMLSSEPVRHLVITNCVQGEDFNRFLRNFRVQNLFSIELYIRSWRNAEIDIALAMRDHCRFFNAHTVRIRGAYGINRMRKISSAMLPKLQRGCTLIINNETFVKR